MSSKENNEVNREEHNGPSPAATTAPGGQDVLEQDVLDRLAGTGTGTPSEEVSPDPDPDEVAPALPPASGPGRASPDDEMSVPASGPGRVAEGEEASVGEEVQVDPMELANAQGSGTRTDIAALVAAEGEVLSQSGVAAAVLQAGTRTPQSEATFSPAAPATPGGPSQGQGQGTGR